VTTTKRPRRVGFIGLGMMGGRMVRRLIAGGERVTVFDLDPRAVEDAVSAGGAAASSPRDLGERCDVVIAMLPSPAILEQAVLGPDGLAEGMVSGALLVDMATDGRSVVHRLAAGLAPRGIRVVDAPVGRGPAEAATGDLIILMGGAREDCESVRDLMAHLGKDIHYCGPLGAGQAVKLVNNMVSSVTMAVVAEGYAMARRANADIEVLKTLMPGSAADSWQLRNGLIGKALAGDFSPRFKVSLAGKDVKLAVEMADELGSPVECGRAAIRWYDDAMESGYGDFDRAAIVLVDDPSLKAGG
jgi:4-hydroxybutyrate dehydrogenase/sulfolactaldehyde 3-reductase